MEAWGIAIPALHAESLRRRLAGGHQLRRDLFPIREGKRVIFPVLDMSATALPPESEVVRRAFPVRPQPPPDRYQDLVTIPDPLRPALPRSFDVVGDVVLIRLPSELEPFRREIGQALLAFVPGARIVAQDSGVHGDARIRTLHPLAGEGGFSTVHRENGISFHVDLERAYFSPRLAGEHARIASATRAGETLLDLFCGVGPFSLTALARNRDLRAIAVDSNPGALEMLRRSARALGVEDRIDVVCEDARAFLAHPGTFSRVVMNLPHEGYKYVGLVAPHVVGGGAIHYYEVTPRELRSERAQTLLDQIGKSPGVGSWSVQEERLVHPYSPGADLVVYTLVRAPRPTGE